jgi:hypothetical protein
VLTGIGAGEPLGTAQLPGLNQLLSPVLSVQIMDGVWALIVTEPMRIRLKPARPRRHLVKKRPKKKRSKHRITPMHSKFLRKVAIFASLQTYCEHHGDFAHEWTKILRTLGTPRGKMLGQRFIRTRGTMILNLTPV